MHFGSISLSYKTASLFIRDQVYFTDSMKMDFLQKMEPLQIDQCMVLATCNRSEVYYMYQNEEQPELVKNVFMDCFPEVDLSRYLETKTGKEAMEYLFRVTAGMESQVLGEDQILGQVKDSLEFARTIGGTGKELNKIVRDAITCAKRMKTELRISEIPLSVSYVGIQQLARETGFDNRRVLIIGSGKTSALALTYVQEYPVSKICLCNRNRSHAEELKEAHPEIEIVDYENRYDVMKNSDIVISATSSPHLVLRHEKAIVKHPVWMLDLAAPRDIDTAFAGDPMFHLLNLDSLNPVVEENEQERARLLEQGNRMIQDDLLDTLEWLSASRMDRTIESLQMRCQEIEDDSFEYLNRKMELSEREKTILRKTLRASLRRLIREPIRELKGLDDRAQQDQYKEVVNHLFQLKD